MTFPCAAALFAAVARTQQAETDMQKIFPTLLVILDVCAAMAYLPTGDWRKVVYWLAAATLTAVITW